MKKKKESYRSGFSSTKTTRAVDECLKLLIKNLHYHTTTSKSARSIVKHGFSFGEKSLGITHLAEQVDPETKDYHYFSRSYEEACWYARIIKDRGSRPEILRVFIDPRIKMERDPHATQFEAAVRTKSDISSSYVLSMPVLHKRDLKRLLYKFGIKNISKKEVSSLKREINRSVLAKNDPVNISKASSYVEEEEKESSRLIEAIKLANPGLQEGEEYNLYDLEKLGLT
jgi:hypothetical protein